MNPYNRIAWLLLVAGLTAGPTAARADDESKPVAAPITPTTTEQVDAIVSRPIVLNPGVLGIVAHVPINLSENNVFEPVSITPDIFYGVIPKLEVGVVHSSYNLSGFWGIPGGGICPVGTKHGCDKFYNGPLGLLANYLLLSDTESTPGVFELAASGGIIFDSFDPFELVLKLGVKGRATFNQLAVSFDPNLFIGITRRDEGNKEQLNLPVTATFTATPELNAYAQTGLSAFLSRFGDSFRIPFTIGADYEVIPNLRVGGNFTLPLLIAGDALEGSDGIDSRVLTLTVAYNYDTGAAPPPPPPP